MNCDRSVARRWALDTELARTFLTVVAAGNSMKDLDDPANVNYPACFETDNNLVVAQMLVLAHQDAKADIHLYINSPGGSVTAGLAIYDTMQWVSCDVQTYCIGQCASMGSLLLAAGAKGKRNALPHGRIMIHQPLAGMEGTATDIMINAEEFIRMKKQLNQIYMKHTGQTLERLQEDTDRDRFMSPEESREYGLIDNVVDSEPAIPANPDRIP